MAKILDKFRNNMKLTIATVTAAYVVTMGAVGAVSDVVENERVTDFDQNHKEMLAFKKVNQEKNTYVFGEDTLDVREYADRDVVKTALNSALENLPLEDQEKVLRTLDDNKYKVEIDSKAKHVDVNKQNGIISIPMRSISEDGSSNFVNALVYDMAKDSKKFQRDIAADSQVTKISTSQSNSSPSI